VLDEGLPLSDQSRISVDNGRVAAQHGREGPPTTGRQRVPGEQSTGVVVGPDVRDWRQTG